MKGLITKVLFFLHTSSSRPLRHKTKTKTYGILNSLLNVNSVSLIRRLVRIFVNMIPLESQQQEPTPGTTNLLLMRI
jgi:hypothetical protein